MPLVVSNSSETIMLQYILNITNPQDLVIRLYSNDVTPDETSTVASFTELAGGGYASIDLVTGSWSIVAGSPAQAEHTEVVWIFTGAAGSVYGYYVTREIGGELMWAERFTNGPYVINTAGDEIRVTPRLTLE